MTEKHLITPPDELVQKWCDHSNEHETLDQGPRYIATQAARWGADQELEKMLAELKELHLPDGYADKLRSSRLSSLKDLALNDLDNIQTHDQEGR